MNDDILKELKGEHNRITRLQSIIMREIELSPDGSLRVCGKTGKSSQYYQYIKEDNEKYPAGKYLNKEEADTIRKLAQKGYDEKLLEWVKKAERRLNSLINCYEHNTPELIYNSLSDIRRELVKPYYLPDDIFLKDWENKWILGRNSYKKKYSIVSQRGELVRSKSEKIIADKLYSERIPYVYEPEIQLENGDWLYPDFAALNVRTRKEHLFEHFGKMGDADYSRRNVKKIEEYALNGYVLGDGLLATFETEGNLFDPKYLDLLVKKYLK